MRNLVADWTAVRRTTALASVYVAIIAFSFYVSYEVRFDFRVPEQYQAERNRMMLIVIAVKFGALVAARQLGSLMTYFSVPDLMKLLWAMSASSVILLVPRLLGSVDFGLPRGVLLTDFMLCFGVLCAGRLGTRLFRERVSGARRMRNGMPIPEQFIAIVGAGDAGASLAKEFVNAPSRGFRPVLFFDDDPSKHGKLVHGVPVVGRPEMITQTKHAETLTKAVIAMPSASAKRIREVVMLLTKQGLAVETIPSIEELASGRVKASRIRPVEVEDLLGREPVNLDSDGIRHLIENRCVMVTGAGGSIGSELCRQIAALHPRRLLMVEQSEGALFIIEQEMNELGFATVAVPLVADVLDRPRMEFVFGRYRPDVVFHAAAHKHVFLMERQPAEAIRNNAFGTRQVAEIAQAHGTDAFVLISTDKAINPSNVMGATKRLAEVQLMAMAWADGVEPPGSNGHGAAAGAGRPEAGRAASSQSPFAARTGERPARRTKFMAVRFGNVLGSSGSVIPIFKRQIANGGPVTVTHPDVTRYFMTIPEAVGLVLQSFVLGKGGEIFVLDMGRPVKIVDLARQMIELSGFSPGADIEIKFTGLKPGEKLFEELQHQTEEYAPTAHPRIMRFTSTSTFEASQLLELEQRLYALDSNQLKVALQKLVPEYTPFLD